MWPYESGAASFPEFVALLKVRVISAVLLGLTALLLTWLGGGYFRILLGAGAAAIFYEWSTMVRGLEGRSSRIVATSLLAVLIGLLLAGMSGAVMWAALAVALAMSSGAILILGEGRWNTVGLAYAFMPAICLALLRDVGAAGLVAILYLFAVVWATDIFAYFAGRRFGGPRLAPAISPGKTWSGAAGGALGGVVAGLAVVMLADVRHQMLLAVLALVLSIASQIGDLYESAVKRRFGVKDSGRLVPGHGGFMDRVDGLVAAAVVLYALGVLAGGAEHPSAGLFNG